MTVEDLQDLVGFKFLNFKDIKVAYSAVCKNSSFEHLWFSTTTLFLIENGQTEIMDEHETYLLEAGDIAVVQPFSKISINKTLDNKTDIGYSSFVFTFLPDFLQPFLRRFDIDQSKDEEHKYNVVTIKKNPVIDDFIYSLHPFFEKKEKLSEDLLKSKTVECLEKLTQLKPTIIPFLHQNCIPTKISLNEFMLNNLLTNYSVPQLAQLSGRSLSSFKREFKETFNNTPHQWILKQKIEMAENVLKHSQLTPVMIYPFLGFRELSHFSSTFRRVKGYNISEVQSQEI